MKIQLDQPILNFNGNPLKQDNKELTFGDVFRQILGTPKKDKENGDKKLKRFNLGIKCVADEVDLTLDERKLIKDLVDEFGFSPVVYGRVSELFEEEKAEA